MGPTLRRYITWQFTWTLVFVYLAVLSLYVTFDVAGKIDFFSKGNFGASLIAFWQYYRLHGLMIAYQVLPLVLAMAAAATFIALARSNQWFGTELA